MQQYPREIIKNVFKRTVEFFLIIVLITSSLVSQRTIIGELSIDHIPDSDSVYFKMPSDEVSILIVNSSVDNVSFESNQRIIKVEQLSSRVYYLHLNPGTHIITFKVIDFLPIKERFYIPKGEYKAVNLVVKDDAQKVSLPTEKGDLVIMFNPKDLSMLLDNLIVNTNNKRKVFFNDIRAGEHHLHLSHQSFATLDSIIVVQPNTINKYYFNLNRSRKIFFPTRYYLVIGYGLQYAFSGLAASVKYDKSIFYLGMSITYGYSFSYYYKIPDYNKYISSRVGINLGPMGLFDWKDQYGYIQEEIKYGFSLSINFYFEVNPIVFSLGIGFPLVDEKQIDNIIPSIGIGGFI